MSFIEEIRPKVPNQCLVERCNKDQCSVTMEGMPNSHLIIDFDKPEFPLSQSETKCDYLVVAEFSNGQRLAIPLEFKSGKPRASEVVDQLQAGANYTEQLIPPHFHAKLKPVLAHKGIKKLEKIKIQRNRITFHGQRETIRLMQCGDSLHQALGRP